MITKVSKIININAYNRTPYQSSDSHTKHNNSKRNKQSNQANIKSKQTNCIIKL